MHPSPDLVVSWWLLYQMLVWGIRALVSPIWWAIKDLVMVFVTPSLQPISGQLTIYGPREALGRQNDQWLGFGPWVMLAISGEENCIGFYLTLSQVFCGNVEISLNWCEFSEAEFWKNLGGKKYVLELHVIVKETISSSMYSDYRACMVTTGKKK